MAVPGKKATERLSLMGSDEDLKVYCQPCDRDGPRLPALGYCLNCCEHLCEECFKLHRRHTMSRHHTLLDKASMPQSMSPTSPTQCENLKNPCPKHKIEMIKFYCHGHKVILCSVCVTLEHTSCKVNYIPDISEKVIDGKEYQDVLKAIKETTEECSKVMQNVKEMNNKSNKSLTVALEDLQKLQTEVNQKLNDWKVQIEEAAKSIHNENSKKLMTIETMNDDITKSLKTSSDLIEHLNTSKQANDLFIELKHAEQMLEDKKLSIAKLTEIDIKEYNFQPDEKITNLLEKAKTMGTLIGQSIKPASLSESTTSMETKQGSDMAEICIKTPQDNLDCWITGIAILTPDLLIITDEANKAVKLVDVKIKSVLDQQVLDSSPWDVTSITQDTVAVTLSDNQIIQFLSVSENKLTKKHTVTVDGECLGISYQDDKLVVSFTNPGKVQILLTNGTVLQTFKCKNTFKYPSYVTTNDQFMFVSDPAKRKTIIKLNWEGEIITTYTCTGKPRGSTILDDGKVFVCNSSNNSIGEITERRITTNYFIKNPQAICWCSQKSLLFVSCLDELEENANYIKIINLASMVDA